MDSRFQRPVLGKTVLLFGPLALSFDQAAFHQIRATLISNEDYRWILETITTLPQYWSTVAGAIPSFQDGPGRKPLEELALAFEVGSLEAHFPLPNILLNPLVIIWHLIQYSKYLEVTSINTDRRIDLYASSKHDRETLGFCTGLLSAMAVSSSGNKEQFQKYGAAAIRLGMLIGMAVDKQDASSDTGASKSFSVVWNSGPGGEEVARILKSYPEAYVSVNYDENRATLTTLVTTATNLQRELKAVSGVIAADIGLYGRFHSECHRADLDSLLAFIDAHAEFQLPDASALVMPTRSNSDGDFITEGQLHQQALRSILIEPTQWFKSFSAVCASILQDKESLIVTFGPERCLPPSITRNISPQVIHMADLESGSSTPEGAQKSGRIYSDNDIAVIGMSCKVAGAENLEEFWDLLCAGKSQHKEVPKERFGFETVYRDVEPKRKWFGNFIDDYDMFDHKFFKKSPREIASTDPQQRHILQTAYQAVEQSGYFLSSNPEKKVGCYVGCCACDYENNIACHAPNAFSATGNLKGFISGKVSHYFGWTGPGVTIDTACSSSAVAVHQACKAIISGECNAALAGGTHVMTNPLWFQNLAGASFLSTTGQCKPFDIKADGYCRGEGVAAVFLKKMSVAIADGDQILGVVAATAVQQNQNCTPIFVPNVPSLSDLFRVVTKQARLKPQEVSVVEAHGTGTAVGDPAEYESIRQVLGGPARSKSLVLSSVKGLVGHIECTSGIVSMIKILLMIQKGVIPPQASFSSMNPALKASPEDNMRIPTGVETWDSEFRAALINNYGASGSNASMVLTQSPFAGSKLFFENSNRTRTGDKYPFWFCGLDDNSLRRYSGAFRKFLSREGASVENLTLPNLSFNLSRQSNRLLDRGIILSCRSVEELQQKLAAYEQDPSVTSIIRPSPKPVVLSFGGQISTFVGLDRKVYENIAVLRKHLDICDAVARSIGAESIYPAIFERAPITDIVKLQTALFAIQYSCAKSWIDSGVEPVAVSGHSFGELAALCISQCLSLEDTMKMIVGRATIIRDFWGSDKGAMIAVEANVSDVENLLKESNNACPGEAPASIACYNGPRSFTIAGSSRAIEVVAETASKTTYSSSVKTKKLSVTNAFHSSLVDPLQARLDEVCRDLTFREPTIPIERSTEFAYEGKMTRKFAAEHMRAPVYYNHAVQRLAKRYPSCVFLEAGSNSTITSMARRALGNPKDFHFQAVNITSDDAWNNLTDATVSLWKSGLNIAFWAHEATQTREHNPILLPPYQFEKSRHWVELKDPPKPTINEVETKLAHEAPVVPKGLLTFVGYQDSKKRTAKFLVNTEIPKYQKLIAGHIMAQTAPICPATVQLDLAIEAIRSIRPDLAIAKYGPQIHSVENQSPICVDPNRSVWITADEVTGGVPTWNFQVFSTDKAKASATSMHTTGKVIFCSTDDLASNLEFARFERLVSYKRCLEMLRGTDADDIIQGRNIYKTFAEIVDYGTDYRGLQKLIGRGSESAGRVVKRYNPETWFDAYLADSFCQVGGIFLNCMTDRSPTDMFIANGIEQWIRSPKVLQEDARPDVFNVFATHHHASDKAYLTDIFIFNAATGALMEVILGISYVKVLKSSMSKLISRLTAGDVQIPTHVIERPFKTAEAQPVPATVLPSLSAKRANTPKAPKPKKVKLTSRPDVVSELKDILVELSGLGLSDIKPDSQLADLGIDSLMGMEMVHEIEATFKITIPEGDFVHVTDMNSLIKCVETAVGSGDEDVTPEQSEDDEVESDGRSIFTDAGSETGASSTADVDIYSFLVDFLGVDRSDLAADAVLHHLGVDSLLSTELRADLASNFDIEIDEHIVIQDLTVQELCLRISGGVKDVSKPAVTPSARPKEEVKTTTSAKTVTSGLNIPRETVLKAFGDTKLLTDQLIVDFKLTDYVDSIMPLQTQMCVALTIEAFKSLGCFLHDIPAGQKIPRIQHIKDHVRLVDYLYQMLEKEASIIKVDGWSITRTTTPCPSRSSKDILQDLLDRFPDQNNANRLTFYTGSQLADVLSGTTDGIKLIFGTKEGRELVSGLYGDWPLNRLFYKQMEIFVSQLVSKLDMSQGPLKILEMGAGTGGTTKWIVPLLARLNVPVEYTFTDLAPSFVAAARKAFKPYPFMKFATHDIEKAPVDTLVGTQHIVIATNAVHATHSLAVSGGNIRRVLRPDGFLMMVEMTGTLYWVDMIFGLFEGWWFFDDGRQHAVTHESTWKRELQSVGYGEVEWTDGKRPENRVEKLIIAMASSTRSDRPPIPQPLKSQSTDLAARQAVVDGYVRKMTDSFASSVETTSRSSLSVHPKGKCILVTGGTGSLGSHLVANFSQLPDVISVVCLNRRSKKDPQERQHQSFTSKGIFLPEEGYAKLKIMETDLAKPTLGLSDNEYDNLVNNVTHIVHNAWLMNAKWPIKNFESQFQIMRNMLDLARDISNRRQAGTKVTFQFISSIATVGHWPLWSGDINVPEERMTIDSVLPTGYGDAKYICELMLDETLHKYPDRFRAMTVRIGQIAGSKTSGYWNPMEHLSFLWKSSQTLNALPNFHGELSWTPVDDVAGTLVDLSLMPESLTPYPIYHVDNPVRQPWQDMIPVLASALNIPLHNAIPFREWVQRVRDHPRLIDGPEGENPAIILIDFLDDNFIRMSCGGLLLDTAKSREHSKTLQNVGPVSEDIARLFVKSWKNMGFLN